MGFLGILGSALGGLFGGGSSAGGYAALAEQSRQQQEQQAVETMQQSMKNSDQQHFLKKVSQNVQHHQSMSNIVQELATDMQSNTQSLMKNSRQKLSQTAAG